MHSVRRFFIIMMATVIIPASLILPRLVGAQTAPSSSSNPNAAVAANVQSYFADIPVMIAIAKCESGPRQFAANGSPLIGGSGGMVGIFQIDETVHRGIAASFGFDIDTVAGNLGYARYLYGRDGTEPWVSSFPCWGSAVASAGTVMTTGTVVGNAATGASGPLALTANLSLGSTDPQAMVLQQLLNKVGFMVAITGPGSPGNETAKFGSLTYAALKAFQCAKGIACSGGEASTGYGFLNAQTRTALLVATSADTSSTATSSPDSTTSATVIASTSITAAPVPAAPATTTTTATAIISTANNPAEIAELQSRIAALVVIIQQLTAQLAARLGH